MDLWAVSHQEVKAFLLILIRVSTILLMFPFFNARVIPVLSKVGLAIIVTIILFPVLNHAMVAFPETVLARPRAAGDRGGAGCGAPTRPG